jgi:hypothetical protein
VNFELTTVTVTGVVRDSAESESEALLLLLRVTVLGIHRDGWQSRCNESDSDTDVGFDTVIEQLQGASSEHPAFATGRALVPAAGFQVGFFRIKFRLQNGIWADVADAPV